MYKKLLLASTVAALTFSGCGSKQYFTPKQTYNASTSNMGDNIVYYSRDGATLASGNILTKNQMVNLKLEKGFHFINLLTMQKMLPLQLMHKVTVIS